MLSPVHRLRRADALLPRSLQACQPHVGDKSGVAFFYDFNRQRDGHQRAMAAQLIACRYNPALSRLYQLNWRPVK